MENGLTIRAVEMTEELSVQTVEVTLTVVGHVGVAAISNSQTVDGESTGGVSSSHTEDVHSMFTHGTN